MLLKFIALFICCSLIHGAPLGFNQAFNNQQGSFLPNRQFLTPPRAVTTLNTYVPRHLIPPAPPRAVIPRVYENPQPRIYTAPPIFRPIQPAPTTRRPFVNANTNTIAPRYAFNYRVNDNRTGDNKSAQERLENGVVTGSYSLTEPDGAIRTVTYTADDVRGFNAVVQRTNQPVAANNNNNQQFTIFTQ